MAYRYLLHGAFSRTLLQPDLMVCVRCEGDAGVRERYLGRSPIKSL